MKVGQLDNKFIDIDTKEALRYLSYKNDTVDEETKKLLEESIAELKEISQLKYVYEIFDISKNNDSIYFENSAMHIKSNDLNNLFKYSKKAAVMAATLGFEVEKKIMYYSLSNLSKAVVFDACAASYIESLCDYAEFEIKEYALKSGCDITQRFSPGYGDVPISHQKEILNALSTQKLIGLSVSDSCILIPRKSVTAFIGIGKCCETNYKPCFNCNLSGNCNFSKEGEIQC